MRSSLTCLLSAYFAGCDSYWSSCATGLLRAGKGVQNEDCDLDAYVEKMKQALSIAFVSQQRELLIAFSRWMDENVNFE